MTKDKDDKFINDLADEISEENDPKIRKALKIDNKTTENDVQNDIKNDLYQHHLNDKGNIVLVPKTTINNPKELNRIVQKLIGKEEPYQGKE